MVMVFEDHGPKKDLIITAGGKNVAPQNLEKRLRAIDGIAGGRHW